MAIKTEKPQVSSQSENTQETEKGERRHTAVTRLLHTRVRTESHMLCLLPPSSHSRLYITCIHRSSHIRDLSPHGTHTHTHAHSRESMRPWELQCGTRLVPAWDRGSETQSERTRKGGREGERGDKDESESWSQIESRDGRVAEAA